MNHLFVDNLTVIDFAYLDPSRGLVGESWIADVILSGELDDQGMVFDFSDVKRTIKRVIDDQVDHCLLIPSRYAGLTRLEGHQDTFEWQLEDGSTIHHSSPQQAVVWLDSDHITTSDVSALLAAELKAALPDNVTGIQLELREEEISGAFYHYVHGLKKHDGNCQRIAHGHRSPIRIDRNGHRDLELERQWAQLWRDIYIGTEEDVSRRFVGEDGVHYIRFDYQANQGAFSLTLPENRVYMLTTDTTVELIAAHIADECKAVYPNDRIRVKAYEGVGKGAIAER
ncbi:6-pyruvoyl trahydropterin synthase family protein [Marinobacter sp. X15-166B]|uniref:6-pyruvoyl trahydropterin synthase family protein n=1 Tax=Marinobacter sp. X15-166B TaxID=1897620 RepID=UPI00085C8A5F|nr:6-carboxytetrahydropterin synthase [Marinobacter sp. X15-166B]OEY67134.1 6-pyruvoyl tetrahydropterin reductase [Marinobacter sp. X15-166B]